MPEGQPRIVVNTGPLLALVAATGGLDVLRGLYCEILVPREVHAEILAGGADGFGVDEVGAATWLTIWPIGLSIEPLVRNALDLGEASVVQLALNEKIERLNAGEQQICPAGSNRAPANLRAGGQDQG